MKLPGALAGLPGLAPHAPRLALGPFFSPSCSRATLPPGRRLNSHCQQESPCAELGRVRASLACSTDPNSNQGMHKGGISKTKTEVQALALRSLL